MNRQNFLGHLALALSLILVAGFAGQLRRWEKEGFPKRGASRSAQSVRKQTYPQRTTADDVLVKFRTGETAEEIQAIAEAHNDRVSDKIEALNDRLVSIDDLDGADAEEVAAEYRALPGVEYAEAIQTIELDPQESAARYFEPEPARHSPPNDPQFAEQWDLENTGQRGGKSEADIRAALAWGATKGDSDLVVAVLDSGVDYKHADLRQNMWFRPDSMSPYSDDELGVFNDERGFNAVDNAADPMDDNGHGTHCAGIIGAEGDNNEGIAGVNWHVQIMPLKFIGPSGSGTTKDAIEAINYVVQRKRAGVNVRIVNASWGSRQYSKALEDVIREAGEEGILFVAAAGNATTDNDSSPHYPSSYDLPNVISVAATDRNDELAEFSNYGKKSVHIAAPGKEIMSTWLNGVYEEHSGTSMAAPVVTGVAALVIAAEPGISMDQLRERILGSVDKLPELKGKVASGGRINAAKAVGAN